VQLDFAFRLARHSLILLSLCTLVFASGNAPDARDVDTRLKLAHEHRLAGHSDEALDELQAVLASIKTDPELRRFQASAELEMAEIYLSRNKLREAAACFEDVIALGSNDAVVHYKLGLVYRDQQRRL
jgi:tetratricopeptide (TPR) repeat protein